MRVFSATRESYTDKAIGYVQVKSEPNGICVVRGKITPEHRVKSKFYEVEVVVNAVKDEVNSCKCQSCAASEGGCKHAIAFLFWLHRRCEEKSVTEQTCYWTAPPLSRVGTAGIPKEITAIVKRKAPPIQPTASLADHMLLKYGQQFQGAVFQQRNPAQNREQLSLHQLVIKYRCSAVREVGVAEDFVEFMQSEMDKASCQDAEKRSVGQSSNPVWDELRYGRVTASKLYKASHCKTTNGSLVKTILGAAKFRPTAAIVRGSTLEADVLKVVANKMNLKIRQSGLILQSTFPVFGASPDGVTDEYVIEVKCPSKEATISNYVQGGTIKAKYLAQIQLQMLFAEKKKGLFCVASPEFENNQQVSIHNVMFNQNYCEKLMNDASKFWASTIFPVLYSK